MSFTKKIIIGLLSGVAAGLFFGEYCKLFSYIGNGFISLMQMTVDEIQRLYAYVLIYTLAVLLLGFYRLPLVISATTGIKPKHLFSVAKDTLITIFATGKIIIVLPQLIDNIKTLFEEKNEISDEVRLKTELITPLAYPFPESYDAFRKARKIETKHISN